MKEIKEVKVLKDLETNLWVILNEDNLQVVTDENGETLKFATNAEAETEASGMLEVWICVKIHFHHRFINHTI
jgi:hypothetical protein